MAVVLCAKVILGGFGPVFVGGVEKEYFHWPLFECNVSRAFIPLPPYYSTFDFMIIITSRGR
jgi:hypothetical protein